MKLLLGLKGEFQIGKNVKPLDPTRVHSIVQFGTLRHSLSHEAKGHSLVYSQLYPFDGLLNYTSGIIHHVRITGSAFVLFLILAIYTGLDCLFSFLCLPSVYIFQTKQSIVRKVFW